MFSNTADIELDLHTNLSGSDAVLNGVLAKLCAAATPTTQFGSEKACGRSYLRYLVDFCRTLLATIQ